MKNERYSSLSRWGAIACLWLLFAQMALAAPQLSLTYDEPIYTAIGYADLTTGDFYWHGVIGHGPLINILTAWPLLLGRLRPDVTQSSYWGGNASLSFAREVVTGLGPLATTALVTRVPVMWLTLLLAALASRWASQAWGPVAGLGALLLFAFEPNLIAHGKLNTTDMGVTAFGFAGAYLLARYLRRPTWGTYVGAGIALGAALASKTSGLFWIGAYGMIVAGFICRANFHIRLHLLGAWLWRLTGIITIGFVFLWACYGLELKPLGNSGFPIPAASYWQGLVYQRVNVTAGQLTFLTGHLYPGGHWSYFLVTLVLKTPPLLLFSIGLAGLISPRQGLELRWSTSTLLAPPVAYLIFSLLVGLNIGHRHLLPILPFLIVFAARLTPTVARLLQGGKYWQRIGIGLLLAEYLLGSIRVFPNYLAYFNFLAGGPKGGYRYLADSSVDWGQGFYALRAYLEAEKADEVYLAAFSSLDPAWYGLNFSPLPPTPGEDVPLWLPQRFNPAPGRYVLSVTPLQGLWLLDPDTYDWFRHQQPTDRVGYDFFIYDVVEKTDAGWVAQCATPQPILDATEIAAEFGRPDLRQAVFNCETSWLYPTGTDGWIVMPPMSAQTVWAAERLNAVPLVYQQREHWSHPALDIYAQRVGPAGAIAPTTTALLAPSAWTPQTVLEEGVTVYAPVAVGDTLSFLGYAITYDKIWVDFNTYWQVMQLPDRPISLMAHLLDANGVPVAIADGLGIPLEYWQIGDVLVQRHRLDYPPRQDSGPYYVQTGVYWLDTLERLPIAWEGQPSGDRLVLPLTLP